MLDHKSYTTSVISFLVVPVSALAFLAMFERSLLLFWGSTLPLCVFMCFRHRSLLVNLIVFLLANLLILLILKALVNLEFLISLREIIEEKIKSGIPKDFSEFQNGLIFGDISQLSKYIYMFFLANGLSHIIAVSGFNMNIVFSLFMLFFRPLPRLAKLICVQICLLAYILMIGISNIPALRAFLMITNVIWAKYFGRVQNIHISIASSVFIILILDSRNISSLSLYLSYLATLAIIVGGKTPDTLIGDLKTNFLILLFTSPVVVLFIGKLNLNGFIANLFILPFVELITYLTIAAIILPTAVGGWVNGLAEFIIRMIYLINITLSSILPFQFDMSGSQVLFCVVSVILILVIIIFRDYKSWIKWQKFL